MGTSIPAMGMGGMFGPQPPEAPETSLAPTSTGEAQLPAAKQLITAAARINSLLKDLAQQFPEISPSVDVALQSLREGVVKATLGMAPAPGEGQPAYG